MEPKHYGVNLVLPGSFEPISYIGEVLALLVTSHMAQVYTLSTYVKVVSSSASMLYYF